MKRHPVLHKLTEDHHHGLVQARHLRAATAETIAGRTRAFLSAWRAEISRHFIEEEQALLPFACPPADPRTPAIAEMLAQHNEIRRLVLDLQRAQHAGDGAACLRFAA
ncbi:MAG: hemerythrin domain-containing protein, partial [Armatimonadetes bacterium]|nr:hemerythrin domain-containing protein [Armatimonadota bacterium]